MTISVEINGETTELPEGISVAAFLAQRGVQTRALAVELNREIVPKSQYDSVQFQAGDRVEIVSFVGGG